MDEKIKELERKAAELSAAIDALNAEAEKEAEELKRARMYYYINTFGEIHISSLDGRSIEKGRRDIGNIFFGKKEAEERVELLKWLAEKPERWGKVKETRFFTTVSETIASGIVSQ